MSSAALLSRMGAIAAAITLDILSPASHAQGVTISVPAAAAAGASLTVPSRAIDLRVGDGRPVTLPSAAANIFVADPKVIEVRPASPTTLFLFGAAPGRTTLAAMTSDGREIAQYEVTVSPSTYRADQASAELSRALPGQSILVTTTASGLALTGDVATPEQADQAEQIVAADLGGKGTVENRLRVIDATQVLLKVRIAEMSRSVTRQLGVDWQAVGSIVGSHLLNPLEGGAVPAATFAVSYINPGLNVTAIIDALAADNLAKMLAEPNLVALSGETANFLSGGEYPIPISQQLGTTTVEYKDYGVSLSFVPTVIGAGRISLRVRPEVSQLTSVGAVTVNSGGNSLSIPALTVSRADTTVELGSGQTFAIAGLLQDNITQTNSSIPVLGDIPYLGGFFRDNTLQHQQVELVFLVTPYVVQPPANPAVVASPGDRFLRPPNDFERLFLRRQTPALTAPMHEAPEATEAGFLVQ